MTVHLAELQLRHVDPSRMLFESRHPAFSESEVPHWYQEAEHGGLRLFPWWRGTVMATLVTKAEKDAYFVVVEVAGLYMTDEQAESQAREPISQVDSSTLNDASDEARTEFSRRVLDDLFPFLRAELYSLSGSLQGINGVMLQPRPEVQVPAKSQASDEPSVADGVTQV